MFDKCTVDVCRYLGSEKIGKIPSRVARLNCCAQNNKIAKYPIKRRKKFHDGHINPDSGVYSLFWHITLQT